MSPLPTAPARPHGLHHLAHVVSDLDRAEAFYVGLLGLRVLRRHDDDAGQPRATWLALAGDAFLALERAVATGPVRSDDAPGLHCLALAIAPGDRATLQQALARAGHPTVRETAFTFYVRDPDGLLLGLSHYPQPIETNHDSQPC